MKTQKKRTPINISVEKIGVLFSPFFSFFLLFFFLFSFSRKLTKYSFYANSKVKFFVPFEDDSGLIQGIIRLKLVG